VYFSPANSVDDFELVAHLEKDDYADIRNYVNINLKTGKLFPLIGRAHENLSELLIVK
jgi:hypothetical protein